MYLYTEFCRYLRTVVNGLEERNDPADSDGTNVFYVLIFQLVTINLLPTENC